MSCCGKWQIGCRIWQVEDRGSEVRTESQNSKFQKSLWRKGLLKHMDCEIKIHCSGGMF